MDEASRRSSDREPHTRFRTVVEVLQNYRQLSSDSRAAVDLCLWQLTDRERRFISERFGFERSGPMSLEDLAEGFAITWEAARELEARTISKLAHPRVQWPQTSTIVLAWKLDAEVLLLRIEGLLTQADMLRTQLGSTREDLLSAEARIRHLEDLNSMLRRELYETSGRSDRKWVGIVATLVLGLAGGFLGVVGQAGGEELLRGLRDTQTSAAIVIESCALPGSYNDSPPLTDAPQADEPPS